MCASHKSLSSEHLVGRRARGSAGRFGACGSLPPPYCSPYRAPYCSRRSGPAGPRAGRGCTVGTRVGTTVGRGGGFLGQAVRDSVRGRGGDGRGAWGLVGGARRGPRGARALCAGWRRAGRCRDAACLARGSRVVRLRDAQRGQPSTTLLSTTLSSAMSARARAPRA